MLAIKFLLFFALIIQNLSENQILFNQNKKTGNYDDSSEACTSPETKIKKEEDKNGINKKEKNQFNKNEIKTYKKEKIKKQIKTKKEEKDLIYSNFFMVQPLILLNNETFNKNKSSFFDFKINKKISKFVNENGISIYPRKRFIGKQQGNFLHFIHLVYEKKLPLFFSVDQILYPYIEITKELQRTIIEKGLFNILHQFLTNIIEYGKKEKYEKGILVYFSIGLKFLDNNLIVMHDDMCQKLIKKILNIDKKDTNYFYNFTLLNNVRKIDKLSFIQILPIFRDNENLKSISDCFRYFQNFEFIIEKELFTIYRIGNLIHKSGEEKSYREIKKFVKYIFNEEENIMNPLDIYLFINKNYKNESSSNENINNLYDSIKDKIIKSTTLKFMSNFTFSNKNEEEEFSKERNSHASLFSFSFNLDEYINYQLINYKKKRFYPSYFEFSSIAHHEKFMKKAIFDRYKGKNTPYTKKLFKFRDGIDFSEVFNSTKDILKQSINNEKYKWVDSYENSFNYLLNIIGHNGKKMKNVEDMKFKVFNTLIGGYSHFKKDILLFEQYTNISYCKNGEIIDLYFDPQKTFYEEIYKISMFFQSHLLDLINCLNDRTIKIDLEQLIEKKMKRLFISYENILKGIELQENDINNDERKKIKDTMFYYDERKNQYQGWYTDLYKNISEKINFDLKIYAHNYFIAKPISKFGFKGAIIYTAMNYPEFGLISIEENENENKTKKLFIFSSYTGNEYPHGWADNINYDGLKKLIISRS